jgi:tetratricopeptide (TPR) repeat protein
MEGSEINFFVGREKELEIVRQGLSPWGGTKFILFTGVGGVGKTTLLREIKNREDDFKEVTHNLIIGEKIESDLTEMMVPLALNEAIVNSFPKMYEDYFTAFSRLRDVYFESRRRGLRDESLKVIRQQCQKVFVESINALSLDHRIVILIDTLEVIQKTEAWKNLVNEVLVFIKNAVIILSGRSCDVAASQLMDLGKQNEKAYAVDLYELTGFGLVDAEKYWEVLGAADISLELRRKITFLSGGRPILLLLSRTWLDEEIPLPLIEEASLVDLERMPRDAFKDLMRDFEAALVQQVLDLSDPLNFYVLYMAHVWRRFNVEILSYLFELSNEGANQAIEALRKIPFIKVKPDGVITLHDEMRTMVTKYAWPIFDPSGDQQRRLSALMVTWYENKIQNTLRIRKDVDDRDGIIHSFSDFSEEQTNLLAEERLRWILTVEQIYYAFQGDQKEGLRLFISTFDERYPEHLDQLRDLIDELELHPPELKSNDQFEVLRRMYLYYWNSGGSLDKIDNIYRKLDELAKVLPEDSSSLRRQLNILELQSVHLLRTNQPIDATQACLSAIEMCDKHPGIAENTSQFYNILGQIYRSRGFNEKAADSYKKALDLEKDKRRRSGIQNNLAYIYSELRREYIENIMPSWNEAFDIRKQLGDDKLMAVSWSTLGAIRRNLRDFEGSVDAYRTALGLFNQISPTDNSWIGRVYSGLGFTVWLQKDLDNAERIISQSIEICKNHYPAELPGTTHRMGHIQWEKENIAEAIKYFSQSLELSIGRSPDFYVNSMCELAELEYTAWALDKENNHIDKISDYLRRTEEAESSTDCRPFSGRVRRAWANLLLDRGLKALNNEEGILLLKEALSYYARAYADIAEQKFARFGLADYLPDLAKRLDMLPREIAIEWANQIEELWNKPGFSPYDTQALSVKYPLMLEFCKNQREKYSI